MPPRRKSSRSASRAPSKKTHPKAKPAPKQKPAPKSKVKAKAKPRARRLDKVILLPVRNAVIFPGVVLPFGIGRERSLRAIQEAVRIQQPIGVLMQRDATKDDPAPEDLYPVGTLAEVLRYIHTEDGGHHAVCQGRARFRVLEVLQTEPYLVGRIEWIPELHAEDRALEAPFVALKEQAREALELMPGAPE
ncbi:MAG: LON peptidase substrate-binding domain-containing protein, partial [Planctomycetia bacterium]